jgi:asparagine synthase (glutamine-hydrolysing)
MLAVSPPGFAAAALATAPVEPCLPEPRAAGPNDPLARALHIDRDAYLRCDLLPKVDLSTLAEGVEGRCPFLDPEVLASPEAEPAAVRRGLGKRALRAAFGARLPAAVLRRPKTGLALPLDRWIREDDFVADVITARRALARPHVRPNGVRAMLDLHRQGRARLGHALYLLAAVELYQQYLEATPCPPSSAS